jgi:hypothetical protein
MAEENKKSPSSIRYVEGLFKDSSHIDQPAGTVRYAKNAIINRAYGALSNEEGNTLMASLPDYSTVIGTIPLVDNEIVLFVIVDDPNVAFGKRNEIGLYNNGTYNTLLRLREEDPDPTWSPIGRTLNFQESNPVEGEYLDQADSDLVVYWTDDLNPPRTLNITRQLESSDFHIYGVNPDTTTNDSPVNILDLFPHTGPVPHVEDAYVNMGGECKTGTYYLALAYTDADNTTTNFVTIANPVSIVPAPEGISPIDSYDGAPPGVSSGKTIRWKVTNLNPDYRYLTAAVIFDVGEGKQARKLPEIEILERPEVEVVFAGERGSEAFSLEEVTIDTVSYTKAKTMTQLDGTLYLGNLESKRDLEYQKYANFIKVDSVVKELNPFDPFQLSTANLQKKDSIFINDRSQGYRDTTNIFKYKGYTREEVYSFYIAFILKDGSMSYAYHIPGRAPLKNVPVADIPELQPGIVGEWNNGAPTTVDEDNTLYSGGSSQWSIINITGSWQDPISHFFQWYDFSTVNSGANNNPVSNRCRQMNFWQNLNEFYPDTDDWDVVDAENPNVAYDPLRTLNVRHNRFPSNGNIERTTVVSSNAEDIASGSSTGTKVTVYWSWFQRTKDTGDGQNDYGGNPEDAPTYKIDMFSRGDLNETSSATDLNNWDYHTNDMQFDNSVGWTGNVFTCFPPGNPRLDPSSSEWNTFSSNRANWCEPPGEFEVEFRYNGYPPPVGSNVIVGWRRQTAASFNNAVNCGNVGFGLVSTPIGGWTLGGNASFIINTGGMWPQQNADRRPGWVAWSVCTPILDESDPGLNLEHKVQALGFTLSDLKIPIAIADQVQGFRIYYADRTHSNRTVLGQSPLHHMSPQEDSDTAGCVGETTQGAVVDKSEYWYPSGIPGSLYQNYNNFIPATYSFHDFYLLNGKKDISAATHIKLQYTLEMFQFKGNVKFYRDELTASNLYAAGDPSCIEPPNYTAFFCSGNHNRSIEMGRTLIGVIANKAKRHVNGGQWLKAKPFGFQKDIYNIGGESMIALRLAGPQYPFSLVSNSYTDTNGWMYSNFGQEPVNGDEISYYGYTAGNPADSSSRESRGYQIHLANLKAFKTDIYDRLDVQDLVWTGYEVVGDEMYRFILDENNTPQQPGNRLNFTTDEIFGGDTYICRYGYRMTSREERRDRNFFPASRDLKSVVFTIVESTDNINFRHIESENSMYFPGSSAADVLELKANTDLSYAPDDETGNMKYNEAYSQVNNIKAILPKPVTEKVVEDHPARVIRSDKLQRDSIIDTYRIFRAAQYRELPTHKGNLWKLVSADNLLYFHMEDTLYRTKGKQNMKLGDGSNAYIGSGDLFAQDPDELKMADTGYMGTRAQRASIVTPFGYFFIDVKTRKIFLISEQGPADLTSQGFGMQRWFQENIPFALEAYGFDGMIDSPIEGMGFHAVWDQRYSRVLLTKRDIIPTQYFIDNYAGVFGSTLGATTARANGVIWVNGSYYIPSRADAIIWDRLEITPDNSQYFTQSGWTISFSISNTQTKGGNWSSFHDYVPYVYSTSGIDIYSFIRGESTAIDKGIYRHDNGSPLGRFYGTTYSFEVEVVHNLQAESNKLFYSVNWLTDVFEPQASGRRDVKDLNAGFTSLIMYNSDANSGKIDLEYLINTRKTEGSWKVNQFRDMSAEITDANTYYTGPFTGSNYGIVNTTVAGTSPTGVLTADSIPMFIVNGMSEILNPAYIDPTKPWYKQGKFIDRFVAFRLICNNLDNNLINLYNTEALYRIQSR